MGFPYLRLNKDFGNIRNQSYFLPWCVDTIALIRMNKDATLVLVQLNLISKGEPVPNEHDGKYIYQFDVLSP